MVRILPRLAGILAAVKSRFRKGDYVYVLVMGRTGTGKSSFVNTATGSHLAVSSSLSSQTRTIQLSRPVKIDSKRVILIDTPGLDMTTKSTEEVVRLVNAYLTKMRKRGTTVHGTIYLHRISDNRMGHIALESLVAFQELCAQEALTNIAIVLNMWEDVCHNVRETRKDVLCTRKAYFKPIVDAGAVIFHHDRIASSARDIIRHLVTRIPQPPRTADPDKSQQPKYDTKSSTRTLVTPVDRCGQEAPAFRVFLSATSSDMDVDEKDDPTRCPMDEKDSRRLADKSPSSLTPAHQGRRPHMRGLTKPIKKFFRTTLLRHDTTA